MILALASLSGWREVFWGLDLGDVHVPIGRYQSEIARVKTLLITAESKRDRERAPVVISALEGELRSRIQHAQNITTHLPPPSSSMHPFLLFSRMQSIRDV